VEAKTFTIPTNPRSLITCFKDRYLNWSSWDEFVENAAFNGDPEKTFHFQNQRVKKLGINQYQWRNGGDSSFAAECH
jgi:hypothetical protein